MWKCRPNLELQRSSCALFRRPELPLLVRQRCGLVLLLDLHLEDARAPLAPQRPEQQHDFVRGRREESEDKMLDLTIFNGVETYQEAEQTTLAAVVTGLGQVEAPVVTRKWHRHTSAVLAECLDIEESFELACALWI